MTRRVRGDHGIAIILMSLLLIPLLAAAAVAVDLGARYSTAAQIQRAADAAALAGVAVLPRGLGAATTEARQVAARNGYEHGVDGVTVAVEQVSAERVKVTITDTTIPEYFIGTVTAAGSIARSSTARYIRAVELGSARNFLGTGDILGTSFSGNDMRQVNAGASSTPLTATQTATLRESFWLAISGTCSSRENGDRFNTTSQANYEHPGNPRGLGVGAGGFACNPGAHGGTVQANPEYRSRGYVYSVAFPDSYDYGQVQLQVWDPRSCSGPTSRSGDSGGPNAATATFTVRTGSTDPLGGTVVAGPTSYTPANNGCGGWFSLGTVTPAAGSTYFVQVQAGQNFNNGTSSNGFALRARVSGRSGTRFWVCSSDPIEASIYDPKCPQVAAVGDMGVWATLSTVASGQPAEFFLAEIGDEHSGKQMEITLFDPGEGAEALRIKDPLGDYVDFAWDVDCSAGVTAPTGGCASLSAASSLDLVGTSYANGSNGCNGGDLNFDSNHDGSADRCVQNPQPSGHRISRWKYNDRPLTLTVDLPADISGAYSGATWWKIEYTTNTAPTDRTTWAVQVKGDPVRLEPNP